MNQEGIYIKRRIEKRLMESIQNKVVTMIIGSRQVGKSTLMKIAQEFIKSSEQKESNGVIHISNNSFSFVLDDIQLRSFLKKDIRYLQKDIELSLGESLERIQSKVYIFIDEVQKVPQLFDWVKQIFDQNGVNIKFILTGSSAVGISDVASETLAGRVDYITVFPFTYAEMISSKVGINLEFFADLIAEIDTYNGGGVVGNSTDLILQQLQAPVQAKQDNLTQIKAFFDRYLPELRNKVRSFSKEATASVVENLFFGGLPRVLTSQIDERGRMIKNYIDVYLEKEIGSVARNLDLELFGLSLQSFAQQNGETLNINQVSKEVGISRPSLYKYLDLLENTYLVKKVYPFLQHGRDQDESTKGIILYYLDTGILNNLSYVTSIQEMIRPDVFQRIIGSWLLGVLLSDFSVLDNVPPIYYWQDYAGHKIDLVFERGDFTFGFIGRIPKDARRFKATMEKFAESSTKETIVIFLPYLDATALTLEYKVNEVQHNGKKILTVEIPLQLLG